MFDLYDKVVLVTGGAGLLGRMHSEAIVANGGKVIVGDIDIESAEKTCKEINELYSPLEKAFPAYLNVLDKTSIQSVLDEYPDINILINNAAIDPKVTDTTGPSGSFESLSIEEWDLSVDVMMKGTFLCSQVFCPHFKNNGGGIVINISSDLGVIAPDQRIYEGSKKPITYSAAKHGIIGMTKYLATYYADSNIRVNSLSPGGVYVSQPEGFVERLTNLIPVGRMAERDEYKGSIVFLCSDASKYMTGHNLIVDGGRTVW
jgi:NAD(P)-dependent dehydrogenase (short-subunit alcohol dehydrogenase family)|tara:strand:- start:844 stop:1623 length:780 start_codon:yes stop_codon:yes gene_type:complete